MKSSLPLPFYLLWPARFLPKKIRGGVGLIALSLLLEWGRARGWSGKLHELWETLRRFRSYFRAGSFLAELGTPAYERVWPNVQGQAPADEILQWFYKAVHTGPSAYGFRVALYAGDVPLESRRFRLSEFPQAREGLRQILLSEQFDGEDVALLVMPLAVFAGTPLRPLPAD